jgi:hypothetical protein
MGSSRKYRNVTADARVAFVVDDLASAYIAAAFDAAIADCPQPLTSHCGTPSPLLARLVDTHHHTAPTPGSG